ncbi:ATP synthase F0 subunit B [Streptomyces sp. NPDC006733]|uniref:ATP synthase F0 subunit B n=1 Tax=Streptomyces sp. NPDC006733 TaxID=3155460 RepID=UPI0033F506BF
MDVQKKLDEIVAAIEGARSMPMSASCVVNRAELLSRLEEVRSALPDSLSQAEALLGGREQMVEEARLEANRIIESAHAERGSMISDTQIARQSQEEAERIVAEANREAEEIRAEADDYVDSKLANFEVVLTKTIGSVDRGREKLLGQGPGLDEQGYEDADAPERSADPETLRRRADEYVDTKLGAFEAVLSKTLEAVGRGRLKLTGHSVADELGAHMAAQDAVEAAGGHQTDAEFMAGLAAPVPAQAQQTDYSYDATPAPAQQDYGYQQEYGQQAGYSDPYTPQQQGYPEQAGYGGYQPEYGQQAYADPQGQYQQQYDQQQHQPQHQSQHQPHHQPAALDETSLFDTGMIDLNRLRELEQGR